MDGRHHIKHYKPLDDPANKLLPVYPLDRCAWLAFIYNAEINLSGKAAENRKKMVDSTVRFMQVIQALQKKKE